MDLVGDRLGIGRHGCLGGKRSESVSDSLDSGARPCLGECSDFARFPSSRHPLMNVDGQCVLRPPSSHSRILPEPACRTGRSSTESRELWAIDAFRRTLPRRVLAQHRQPLVRFARCRRVHRPARTTKTAVDRRDRLAVLKRCRDRRARRTNERLGTGPAHPMDQRCRAPVPEPGGVDKAFHRKRVELAAQRPQTISALRGHLAEYGVTAPQGPAHVGRLARAVEDPDSVLPEPVRELGGLLLARIAELEVKIAVLETDLSACVRQDEEAARLMTMPGIGPVTATGVSESSKATSSTRAPNRKRLSTTTASIARVHDRPPLFVLQPLWKRRLRTPTL